MGKNKIRIQGYISPYLAGKIDKLIEERGLSSRSEFVSYAVHRLVIKLEGAEEEGVPHRLEGSGRGRLSDF